MNELEKLKRKLFKQEPKEDDVFRRLCQVIEICGGYQNFLETPIPIILEIIKYLEYQEKTEAELYKSFKIPHMRKR